MAEAEAVYRYESGYIAHAPKKDYGPLDFTGKIAGGLRLDIRRRAPLWCSDWTDAFLPENFQKSVSSILYLFIAALAPAITFGSRFLDGTNGQFGVLEMIMSTCVSGMIFSTTAGQPLSILGATGPFLAYTLVVYDLAIAVDVEFMPFYFWTCMWCSLFTILVAVFDLCALMKHVTMFSEDIFAGLISLIFIIDGVRPIIENFTEERMPLVSAMFEALLFLYTFGLSTWLSAFRRKPWSLRFIRNFAANFAVTIALVTASAWAALYSSETNLRMLQVDADLSPNLVLADGSKRPWVVNPSGIERPFPAYGIAYAILPAIGFAVLGYLDQNLTSVIVNRPSNGLKKPPGYHLDLFVRGALTLPVCAVLGLPLSVASTVPSITHVISLTTYDVKQLPEGERKVPVKVVEQRATNFIIHILIGCALFLAPALKFLPRAVLQGVFFYMGIASLTGNNLFDRLKLWLIWDPAKYPQYHYVQKLPIQRVHLYTLVQVICLGILYGLKAIKETSVVFPFFMASLAIVRKGMRFMFTEEELKQLDGLPGEDEEVEEEAQGSKPDLVNLEAKDETSKDCPGLLSRCREVEVSGFGETNESLEPEPASSPTGHLSRVSPGGQGAGALLAPVQFLRLFTAGPRLRRRAELFALHCLVEGKVVQDQVAALQLKLGWDAGDRAWWTSGLGMTLASGGLCGPLLRRLGEYRFLSACHMASFAAFLCFRRSRLVTGLAPLSLGGQRRLVSAAWLVEEAQSCGVGRGEVVGWMASLRAASEAFVSLLSQFVYQRAHAQGVPAEANVFLLPSLGDATTGGSPQKPVKLLILFAELQRTRIKLIDDRDGSRRLLPRSLRARGARQICLPPRNAEPLGLGLDLLVDKYNATVQDADRIKVGDFILKAAGACGKAGAIADMLELASPEGLQLLVQRPPPRRLRLSAKALAPHTQELSLITSLPSGAAGLLTVLLLGLALCYSRPGRQWGRAQALKLEFQWLGGVEAHNLSLYEDPEFPPTDASLGGITGDQANPQVSEYLVEMMKLVVPGWARPRQMVGKQASKYKLFATEGEPCLFKHVSPRDIEQGYLGDCWLVSSFAAIAEYPDRVRSLFKQNELTADGRYDIRLYDPLAEEWQVVTIDDRLPYWQRPGKHGTLCFAKPTKENEFWTCLLEKAVAKFVKSYHRIDGGFEAVALEMLTGKPSLNIQVSNLETEMHSPYVLLCGKEEGSAKHATVHMRLHSYDAGWGFWGQDASVMCEGQVELSDDWLWGKLCAWNGDGYSLCCGSRQEYKGILEGHAYTLLRLVEVPIERDGKSSVLRLLHVRNPHHTNEWFGKFHDDDWETWNAYPEALKATGHKVGIKDNGVFWMPWDEFKGGFADIAVNFDKKDEGRRYTDESKEAAAEHQKVAWGQVGYQKWLGL
ncbi:SLC4A4 [Symbiodinium sp. CCMP2456]|nr:SLC4A4 [Symbiodinium sp. CCMP2456]